MADHVEIIPKEDRVCSRRDLLVVLTSAAGLATGGLNVPEVSGDVLAREVAKGGELGGRHGHNHRGRGKRRHSHRKDEKKRQHGDPSGSHWLRDIAFEIHNGAQEGASYTIYARDGDTWNFVAYEMLKVGGTVTVDTSQNTARLDMGYHRVLAENFATRYPKITISKPDCDQECIQASAYMSVNQVLTEPGFEVRRLDDDADHIRFHIEFLSRI